MARKKGKKLKLLRGEKAMYLLIVLLVALIPLVNVFTSAALTKTNIAVEELKTDIENQKSANQSLSMQIDELASLENIKAVAKEYGLSYDNTNILMIR